MSDKSASTGKFVLAAVIVLAGMVPAGYVAFDFLRKELKSHQAETRSVVMDLQTQTVEEIRAGTRTETFIKAVSVPVHVPLSGKTMSFDGMGKCTSGC
jgi:hypothetical protein